MLHAVVPLQDVSPIRGFPLFQDLGPAGLHFWHIRGDVVGDV